jgi:hypothetical protein
MRNQGTGRNVFYVGTDRAMHQFVVANGWQDKVLGGTVGAERLSIGWRWPYSSPSSARSRPNRTVCAPVRPTDRL